MATIRDVASRAGVSFKSVSRVLNNEPHVRPDLRDRIMKAVEELNYRPNQAARRMAGKRSFLIAYLYRNPPQPVGADGLQGPGHPYFAGIQSGAAQYCREHGYHLVIEPVPHERLDLREVVLRLVHTLAPDAIFVAPPLSDNPDLLEIVSELGVRLIRIAGMVEGPGDNITLDERTPSRDMTRHLIQQGHRKIAFIRSPAAHLSAAERYLGYCDALAEAAIPIDPALVVEGTFDFASGQEGARKLLERDPADRPTAIFASNDEMALGVITFARKLGLTLPDDLSVAGFDDIPGASTNWPSLTTVRQPLAAYGAAAAGLAINNSIPEGLELQGSVILRSSTLLRNSEKIGGT